MTIAVALSCHYLSEETDLIRVFRLLLHGYYNDYVMCWTELFVRSIDNYFFPKQRRKKNLRILTKVVVSNEIANITLCNDTL